MVYIEILNTILTIISVYLFSKEIKNGWLVSIGACLTMAYLYWYEQLWFESSIQFIFIFHSFVAYFEWGIWKKINLTHCVIVYIIASFVPLIFLDVQPLKYIDMFLMSISLIANHLMVLRYKFAWILWLVFDLLSIFLCLYLKLYITLGLFVVLTGICCKVIHSHYCKHEKL